MFSPVFDVWRVLRVVLSQNQAPIPVLLSASLFRMVTGGGELHGRGLVVDDEFCQVDTTREAAKLRRGFAGLPKVVLGLGDAALDALSVSIKLAQVRASERIVGCARGRVECPRASKISPTPLTVVESSAQVVAARAVATLTCLFVKLQSVLQVLGAAQASLQEKAEPAATACGAQLARSFIEGTRPGDVPGDASSVFDEHSEVLAAVGRLALTRGVIQFCSDSRVRRNSVTLVEHGSPRIAAGSVTARAGTLEVHGRFRVIANTIAAGLEGPTEVHACLRVTTFAHRQRTF
jgi:hypothetical protein